MAEVQTQTAGLKIEQAAALLRLSTSRVKQLISEGWIKRDGDGKLTIVNVVHGYLDLRDDEVKRITAKAADNEVRRARAREITLRTAKAERELVPRDDAEEFVQLLIGEVVARLQGLPARFTRDVNERSILEQLIRDVRKEVAEIAAKHVAAFQSGAEPSEAAGEDDAG